jgi:hypothetical protein
VGTNYRTSYHILPFPPRGLISQAFNWLAEEGFFHQPVFVQFWDFVKKKKLLLQIPNQLHFFTKIGDFLHARCKKSLLDVKNLPVDSRRN